MYQFSSNQMCKDAIGHILWWIFNTDFRFRVSFAISLSKNRLVSFNGVGKFRIQHKSQYYTAICVTRPGLDRWQFCSSFCSSSASQIFHVAQLQLLYSARCFCFDLLSLPGQYLTNYFPRFCYRLSSQPKNRALQTAGPQAPV